MLFGKHLAYQYGQKNGCEACAYHYMDLSSILMPWTQCVMENYLGYLSALIEAQIDS